MIEKGKLSAAVLMPLSVGGLAGFLTRDGMAVFGELEKPPLSPPGWLFPIAWTILYVLMGIASYLIYETKTQEAKNALIWYGVQLAVNFVWPLLFFGAGLYAFSFVWLVFLWYLVYQCMQKFAALSVAAGRLMVPYLLWLTFAGYLNLAIALLN